MRRVHSALIVGAIGLVVAVGSPVASAATDFRIDVSGKGKLRSFGGFNPQGGDPSPAAAAAVFGPGTVLSDTDTSCEVSYAVGVLVIFADFGSVGVSACSEGGAQTLKATGLGWFTNRGLAIGDSTQKMKALYREDKLRGRKFELIDKRARFGTQRRTSALTAFVSNGSVDALAVFPSAAGD